MQLGHSKAVGSFNNHTGGIGNINSNFNNGCGCKHLNCSVAEGMKQADLFFFFNPAVNKGTFILRIDMVAQVGKGPLCRLNIFIAVN